MVRVGKQMRLALHDSEAAAPAFRDLALIKLVARAQWVRSQVHQSAASTLDEAAAEVGLTRNYLARLIRLSFLVPDIITAILDGNQPAALTRQRLALLGDLPLLWSEQRALLGFAAQA